MNWKIVQQCIKGQKEFISKCEDSCDFFSDENIQVMALCDGISQSEYADIGAQVVSSFSVSYFKLHFDDLINAQYEKICDILIQYHQSLLLTLSEKALEVNKVFLLENKKINITELKKYCTTVQVVALKDEKAVYFKVGNGAAIISNSFGLEILSDSSTEPETKHITFANTLNVLKNCEFRIIDLADNVDSIILLPDGCEFEDGLFFNHKIQPELHSLSEQIKKCITSESLLDFIKKIRELPSNCAKDDVGISIAFKNNMYSECLDLRQVDFKSEIVEDGISIDSIDDKETSVNNDQYDDNKAEKNNSDLSDGYVNSDSSDDGTSVDSIDDKETSVNNDQYDDNKAEKNNSDLSDGYVNSDSSDDGTSIDSIDDKETSANIAQREKKGKTKSSLFKVVKKLFNK